jgi:hypothetical protein
VSEILIQFLFILAATEVASILFLYMGSALLDNPILLKLGEKAHVKKIKALDKMWPLTKIRPALAENNPRAVTKILSGLIILKSIMSFFFGILMVVWLPLSSLMVPSIIHLHDPNDPSLQQWVKRVSFFQITSHAVAAALGATLFLEGYMDGSIDFAVVVSAMNENMTLVIIVLFASLLFALFAGKVETDGIFKRGI